jgi:hypothetical protein
MFSRAQVLRRDGTAPAALGIADDLPDRMAYQQLNILAGMAGKVSWMLCMQTLAYLYSARRQPLASHVWAEDICTHANSC